MKILMVSRGEPSPNHFMVRLGGGPSEAMRGVVL